MHKKSCKEIHKLRGKVEEGWAGPPPEARESRGPQLDDYIERTLKYATASETFQLGDVLLQVGYRESDTVEHGNSYYREALRCYLRPMGLLEREYYSHFGWIEDRVLLLLVLLGGDAGAIEEWCHCDAISRGRKRGYHFCGARTKLWGLEDERGNTPDAPPFGISGYAVTADLPFQGIMLLSEMRSMAKYRQNPEGSVEAEVDELNDRVGKAMHSIRYHGNGGLVESIRDDIPLKPAHAPGLFAANEFSRLGEGHLDRPAPPELWMLYQDCFFETPGAMSVLDEFASNE